MQDLEKSEAQVQEALEELLRVVEDPVRPSHGFRGKKPKGKPDRNGEDGWGVFGYLAAVFVFSATVLCCVERAVEAPESAVAASLIADITLARSVR